MPRTMTVRVCVAALPPMPATIGMNTASAVIRSIVPSKSATTDAARNAVDQVDAQPRQPLAQRLPRRRERALVAGHAGQTIDVFGRLVLDDVDDVVNGDDADQLVLFVDDRNGEEVVGRDLARHFLLVHVDARA